MTTSKNFLTKMSYNELQLILSNLFTINNQPQKNVFCFLRFDINLVLLFKIFVRL